MRQFGNNDKQIVHILAIYNNRLKDLRRDCLKMLYKKHGQMSIVAEASHEDTERDPDDDPMISYSEIERSHNHCSQQADMVSHAMVERDICSNFLKQQVFRRQRSQSEPKVDRKRSVQ